MKKFNLLIAFAMLFALVSCGNKSDSPESIAKEMEEGASSIKTFFIEQKTTTGEEGASLSMHTKIWHDAKKDRTASEITTETIFNDQTTSRRSLYIEDNEGFYSINLDSKTGMRIAERNNENLFDNYTENEEEIVGMFNEDEKIIGRETYAGKPCVVIETYDFDDDDQKQKVTVWIYNGIPLKVVSNMYNVETIKFEENINIPDSKFEVPAGIEIKTQ